MLFGAGTRKIVEDAVAQLTNGFTQAQHLSYLRVGVTNRQLAATDGADRAVGKIRAEGAVDVVQPFDHLDDRLDRAFRIADIDADSHAHHVFDVMEAAGDPAGGHIVSVRPAERASSMAD